ncbi:MAG: pyridoxal phosphate-dependent aminotransferase [Flavimaricola sp.]|nr:pyridoxal phosphate-dependent aminotransferase [Flavimaricola sp.]
MTNDPRFTPLAAALPASVPFVGPETQERRMGRAFSARLGANENAFGPSPQAIAAMQAAASDAWMYGDPENHDLRQALALHHGCSPDHIIVGEGIDGLLGYIVRLIIGAGDRVVTSAGAYPTFNYHVTGFGGEIVTVPYTSDYEDPERLIAKARQTGAKLIYIANPDNPMGTWHDANTIGRMVDAVPDGTLLLLDEAYIDLAPDGTAPRIDPEDPRVLRFRTFSKAHGLAGARVGYAIGNSAIISAFDRVRNHFGMSKIGQAGALAALNDQAWLAHIRNEVASARDRIVQIAAQNGLSSVPSATNFVAIDCGQDGDFARKVLAGLVQQGVFVRMPFVSPQDRCVRISAGRPSDLELFEQALPLTLDQAKTLWSGSTGAR